MIQIAPVETWFAFTPCESATPDTDVPLEQRLFDDPSLLRDRPMLLLGNSLSLSCYTPNCFSGSFRHALAVDAMAWAHFAEYDF